MDKNQVQGLAKLARVEMSDTEMEALGHDLEHILSYVSNITAVAATGERNELPSHRNQFAEDVVVNTTGEYRDDIIAAFPDSLDGFLKVKSILNQ
jgi:aspartyl/glutamyl-tRNA(Asn/Gln) amidotransferase C subunit